VEDLRAQHISQVILDNPVTVSTFYKFTEISDVANLRLKLYKVCNENDLLGTILISAIEGINGTVAGHSEALAKFYSTVASFSYLEGMEFKESWSDIKPFSRLKVKIKKEIITFGVPEAHGKFATERLDFQKWESLIDQGAKIIDTRNDYEYAFGTFNGAINPNIRNFTDLAKWMDENLQDHNPEEPILMFCTGGVRCEKSTSYLRHKRFKKIYHLDGGIIKYLQTSPNKRKYWHGDCFVFDDRIALDHDLKPAIYCNTPIQKEH
jgi:UPF0176 protein